MNKTIFLFLVAALIFGVAVGYQSCGALIADQSCNCEDMHDRVAWLHEQLKAADMHGMKCEPMVAAGKVSDAEEAWPLQVNSEGSIIHRNLSALDLCRRHGICDSILYCDLELEEIRCKSKNYVSICCDLLE